jgi:phytoene synthase
MTARLLAEADRLYLRAEAGISALPRKARMGIWAARLIYAGIGAQVRRQGCNSINQRARTGKARKIVWMGQAGLHAATSLVMPQSAVIYAPPLPEVAFLIDAAGQRPVTQGRTHAMLDILADLSARQAGVGRGGQGA